MTFVLRVLLFMALYYIGMFVGMRLERRRWLEGRAPQQLPKQPLERLLDAGKEER